MTVEVFGMGRSTEYLGRRLEFQDFFDSQIDHRIAKAWAKFYKFKSELCSKVMEVAIYTTTNAQTNMPNLENEGL